MKKLLNFVRKVSGLSNSWIREKQFHLSVDTNAHEQGYICDDWENFVTRYDRLELPTNQLVTAQQVLIGVAFLGAPNDIEVAHQTLKYTRVLKNMV